MRHYIGVTGITDSAQIGQLAALFPNRTYGGPAFMAGILVSGQTLRGLTNRFPGRYPKREHLSEIFVSETNFDCELQQVVHFNTDAEKKELLIELLAIVGLCPRQRLSGIQLNLKWPAPWILHEFKHLTNGRHDIILQIGRNALYPGIHPYSAEIINEKIAQYEGAIDAILLDPSGGEGKTSEPKVLEYLRECIDYIGKKNRNLTIGIAGGFSHETLDTVAPILKEFNRTSIDAEGKLMNERGMLDIEKATRYIKKAFTLRSTSHAEPFVSRA